MRRGDQEDGEAGQKTNCDRLVAYKKRRTLDFHSLFATLESIRIGLRRVERRMESKSAKDQGDSRCALTYRQLSGRFSIPL